MLDGPDQLIARCGWSFVALSLDGEVSAVAYGVCPPWVFDIHGAEVWALMKASQQAMPGQTVYRIDCESVVLIAKAGRARATAADKMHARAYGLLFAATDDANTDVFRVDAGPQIQRASWSTLEKRRYIAHKNGHSR